jgi:ATP-dependent Clp protease protease subunit
MENKDNEKLENLSFSKRVVFLSDPITNESFRSTCEALLALEHEKKQPIHLFIHSTGGSVGSALGIVDTINFMKSRGCIIYTVAIGLCYSCAALVLCAGTKAYVSSNASLMIHQISFKFDGSMTVGEMQVEYKDTERMSEILTKMIVKKTGKSYEVVKEAIKEITYMSAEEAIKFGIADEFFFHE